MRQLYFQTILSSQSMETHVFRFTFLCGECQHEKVLCLVSLSQLLAYLTSNRSLSLLQCTVHQISFVFYLAMSMDVSHSFLPYNVPTPLSQLQAL